MQGAGYSLAGPEKVLDKADVAGHISSFRLGPRVGKRVPASFEVDASAKTSIDMTAAMSLSVDPCKHALANGHNGPWKSCDELLHLSSSSWPEINVKRLGNQVQDD